MVFDNSIDNENIRNITLTKHGKQSFGICIVRGEINDTPYTKRHGIFVKGMVPNSPAHCCGKLKVGDQVLSINEKDLKNATEQMVIEYIKTAGDEIKIRVQNCAKIQDISKGNFKPLIQNEDTVQEQTPLVSRDTIKRPNFSASIRSKHNRSYRDDNEEDTRDMTGRIRTAFGYEIDRASAGNCKLNKLQNDKEQEDEYGYTMAKILKRYSLMQDLKKIEIIRSINEDIGIALAGHRDRRKMSCFIVAVNSQGQLGKEDIQPGDEILEINGNVLQNRCHLNSAVIIKNIDGPKLVLIISRNNNDNANSFVKSVQKFPTIVDDTKFIFEQFPNARSIQIKKDGFLGIMVIYGKHVDVGNGIFISDLREDSNAAAAGIKVGDLLLAINKDVLLESNYDEAVTLIKRSEGIISLVVLSLKTEPCGIAAEEAVEKQKEKEPEKPQDPATAEIQTNKKTQIELKIEKNPCGIIVVGGNNNFVKTGCIITHIYANGAVALDNRLKIFDHLIEVNGHQINCSENSSLKVHQIFHSTHNKPMLLQVYRSDPPEVEKFLLEYIRKPGKNIGLSLAPNNVGCVISEIIPPLPKELDNKIQRGDIISKFNGQPLQDFTFEQCFAIIKSTSGKICLEITRPKPKCRSEAAKN